MSISDRVGGDEARVREEMQRQDAEQLDAQLAEWERKRLDLYGGQDQPEEDPVIEQEEPAAAVQ